jgi:O-antigen ligase
MSKQANTKLIGGFVVGAAILVIVGVLLFGSGKFLTKQKKFVLFFEDSVSGLSVGAPVLERNFALRVFASYSVLTRFQIWGAALRAIAARPIFGTGPDSFGLAYTPFEPAAIAEEARPEERR